MFSGTSYNEKHTLNDANVMTFTSFDEPTATAKRKYEQNGTSIPHLLEAIRSIPKPSLRHPFRLNTSMFNFYVFQESLFFTKAQRCFQGTSKIDLPGACPF